MFQKIMFLYGRTGILTDKCIPTIPHSGDLTYTFSFHGTSGENSPEMLGLYLVLLQFPTTMQSMLLFI